MLTVGEVASKQQYALTPTRIISPCDACIRPQPPGHTRLPDIQREGLVHIYDLPGVTTERRAENSCVWVGVGRRERSERGGVGGNCRRENTNWGWGGGETEMWREREGRGKRTRERKNMKALTRAHTHTHARTHARARARAD